jgi:hypothetical protein
MHSVWSYGIKKPPLMWSGFLSKKTLRILRLCPAAAEEDERRTQQTQHR